PRPTFGRMVGNDRSTGDSRYRPRRAGVQLFLSAPVFAAVAPGWRGTAELALDHGRRRQPAALGPGPGVGVVAPTSRADQAPLARPRLAARGRRRRVDSGDHRAG